MMSWYRKLFGRRPERLESDANSGGDRVQKQQAPGFKANTYYDDKPCANHPNTKSIATCKECKATVCENCLRVEMTGGMARFYCGGCRPAGQKPGKDVLRVILGG